jgi:hypothetical protein
MGATGVSDDARANLTDLFRVQELICRGLGSPLWADMCTRLADDVERGGSTWTALADHAHMTLESVLPLRILGGLHRMALAGDAPELARHLPSTGGDGDAEAIQREVLRLVAARPPAMLDAITRPPQTNEVGRSTALVCGFLVIADETRLPLRVLEIGSSAGLNLRFDHFRYEQGGAGFGPVDSPVRFEGYWASGEPPWGAPLTVASRQGCDLDPIDSSTPEGRLTLLSYVWPDQAERFARLAAAIDIAASVPATVEQVDAVSWLTEHLAEPVPDVATVVFHSNMWQYLGEDTQQRIRGLLAAAGVRASARAPLAWLRLENEKDGAIAHLIVTTWPDGEERILAEGSFHLGPITWLA